MITCHKRFLEARCGERGYTLDEVMPCVVVQNGDTWTVDTEHPAYPAVARAEAIGAGTELKKLLAKIGITSSPTCSCNQRMKTMNARGVEWCEQNKDEIVGWLREEAKKRKLPFIDLAGYAILNFAIRRAKRANRK